MLWEMGLGHFVKGDSDCSLQILGGWFGKVDFIFFIFIFALRVDLGLIEADIIECLAGLATNWWLGNHIFSMVLSVETGLDSWCCLWWQAGSPLLTARPSESMRYIQRSFGAKCTYWNRLSVPRHGNLMWSHGRLYRKMEGFRMGLYLHFFLWGFEQFTPWAPVCILIEQG